MTDWYLQIISGKFCLFLIKLNGQVDYKDQIS